MVFPLEAECSKQEMNAILLKPSDFYGIFVDVRGRVGELAIHWDKKVLLNILSYSFHHINVFVQWEGALTFGDSVVFLDLLKFSRLESKAYHYRS